MIFVNYGLAVPSCVLVGHVIPSVLAFRALRKKWTWIRNSVTVISVLAIAVSAYVTTFRLWVEGHVTRSMPIYSPNRSNAIRILEVEGPLGEDSETYIKLYSYFGLSSEVIFYEGTSWNIHTKNIRWLNSSGILINLPQFESQTDCGPAKRVKVRCELFSAQGR